MSDYDEKKEQLFMNYAAEMKAECERHDEAVKIIALRYGRRLETLAKEEHGRGEGVNEVVRDGGVDNVSNGDGVCVDTRASNSEAGRLT